MRKKQYERLTDTFEPAFLELGASMYGANWRSELSRWSVNADAIAAEWGVSLDAIFAMQE